MTTGVRWRETMAVMTDSGVDTLVEIGPGNVLSGLAKRSMSGITTCLLYTSPSPRDRTRSRMPSSA